MTEDRFFGFGSLVNDRTHDHTVVGEGFLPGFRRQWVCTPNVRWARLSIEPDTNCAGIHGLVASVAPGAWPALDLRERDYTKLRAPCRIGDSAQADIWVYRIPRPFADTVGTDHPILRSYLDVVAEGFFDRMGAEGINHLFATTQGWHAPVLDDRAAPIYGRHHPPGEETSALVDSNLRALKSPVLPAGS